MKVLLVLLVGLLSCQPKLFVNGNFKIIFDSKAQGKIPKNLVDSYSDNKIVLKNTSKVMQTIKLNPSLFASVDANSSSLILNFVSLAKFTHLNISTNGKAVVSGEGVFKDMAFSGAGKVLIYHLPMQQSTINLSDSVKVLFEGFIAPSKIIQKDQSQLDLFWVDSKKTEVELHDFALLNLAGRTEKLVLDLDDYSKFYGARLKAKEGYVNAENKTFAKLDIIETAYIKATDFAALWYKNVPQKIHSILLDSANFLPVIA